MIKTKINEGRYVDAFSKLAQSFNIRSKPKVEKPSTITQNKEESKEQETISIPSNWKPKPKTEIELDNKKYKVNDHGFWYLGSKQLPVKSEKDLISSLNLEAYKQEKNEAENSPIQQAQKKESFLTDEEKENILNANSPTDFILMFNSKLPDYIQSYIKNTPINLNEVLTAGALLGILAAGSAPLITVLVRRIKNAKNDKEQQIHLMKIEYKTLLCIYYLLAYPNLDENLFNSTIKIKIENALAELNNECKKAKNIDDQFDILDDNLFNIMNAIQNKFKQKSNSINESLVIRWKQLAGIRG